MQPHDLDYASPHEKPYRSGAASYSAAVVLLTIGQTVWFLPGAYLSMVINCDHDGASGPMFFATAIWSLPAILAFAIGIISFRRLLRERRAIAIASLAISAAFLGCMGYGYIHTITHRSPNDIWCP